MSARWFWALVIVAILCGTGFRIVHAESRLFWGDEGYTALRVSGHSIAEFRSIFNGNVYSRAAILRYQQFDPSMSYTDEVKGLAAEEPQHTPLFYVFERAWANVFGSSIPSLRAVAMIFALLAVLALYWFAFELTGDVFVAGAAGALLAVSPIFVDYGAQAREYSLYTAMAAAMSALLLRALRLRTSTAWIVYGVAAALGLYSDLLLVCVLVAHAIYLAVEYREDVRTLRSFGFAAGAALLLFVPWIVQCVVHWSAIVRWQAPTLTPYPLSGFLVKWVFNITATLFDGEYASLRLAPVAAVAFLVLAYATVSMFHQQRRSVWLFVAALGGVIALEQIVPDVIVHGHGSTTARYLMPLWLALLLAVALLFGKRRMLTAAGALRAGPFAAFCAIVLIEIAGTAINSTHVGWWDNNGEYPATLVAARINDATGSPLVVSEGHWAELFEISHYVKPDVTFLLFNGPPPQRLPPAPVTFLLDPSHPTLAAFMNDASYRIEPVPVGSLVNA
ncbi:MAG TPA: glycosyltransferase family 39 protein, partial [Candidatus Baltobacteraceae bacterium]|nr:glycosyltransferase family 39 protein [Candidatus Baltobacteraceae bacterium]